MVKKINAIKQFFIKKGSDLVVAILRASKYNLAQAILQPFFILKKIYHSKIVFQKKRKLKIEKLGCAGTFYLSSLFRQTIILIFFVFLLLIFISNKQSPADNIELESPVSKIQEINFENSDNNTDNVNITPVESVPETDVENNINVDTNNGTNNINKAEDLPKLLEIPAIGVNAEVQYVGLNSNDGMDVPSNDVDVAWFDLGAKPGETGSAVIAGHLDTKSGSQAVFWNLHELKSGDYIYIVNNDNSKKRFRVISIRKYGTDEAPMEKIFGLSDGRYLNLITCGGKWDKTKNNYSERLVVFTEYSPL